MKIGLIGKPNTGKSTFFNACTLLNVNMANYPFTTIEPSTGVAYVKTSCVCKELEIEDSPVNSICIDNQRLIPVKIVDIAGLVPGASKGRGLGNKFLDDIRQADVLIHVIDLSGKTDEEGRILTDSKRNPIDDITMIETELDNWIYDIIDKDWDQIGRTSTGDKKKFIDLLSDKLSGLSINQSHINASIKNAELVIKSVTEFSNDDKMKLVKELRKISKPIIIAGNKIDLAETDDYEDIKKSGREIIPTASEAELLLRRASENGVIQYVPGNNHYTISESKEITKQQKNALETVKKHVLDRWDTTGVQLVLNFAFFDLLDMITVYPVEDENKYRNKKGNTLPDAYLLKNGSTAKDLAFKIHSEIGNKFLYAVDARTKKRVSNDYVLKNNDIIKIVST
uniref:Translation-associated GTPase n=1 Tax=uncultured marine thaumarchaeote KM3_90_G11 TaxID=1456344 RepID=A0A075HW66_9ARCH|nr:translation-associated GTPase [uncultured marine thaumarchaeote KM3_90_G11]